MNPADQTSASVRKTRTTGSDAASADATESKARIVDRIGRGWARRHEPALLILLTALAVIDRGLLALRSPTPYGYVFDFYHEAIQKFYALGRLPIASDCWQCY